MACAVKQDRSFTATSAVAAKSRNNRTPSAPKSNPKIASRTAEARNDARLQAAPTVASHTEGVPAGGEEEEEEEEALTWRDYDPAGGMPLPNGELSQPEINAVFNGEEVDADTGNYILSVMHWRRMSGALIDVGLDFPNDSGVHRDWALKGLQYVRVIVPDVDESAAGQSWAEEESQRLQEEIQARAVKLGIYKAAPEEEQEQEQAQEDSPYAPSQLQRMREEKEAAWEKEQERRAVQQDHSRAAALHSNRGPLELGAGVQPTIQARTNMATKQVDIIRAPAGGVNIRPPAPKAWLQPVKRKPWVKYYEEQAEVIKGLSVPQLSLLQRLGGPFLVTLLVLAGCYYLSENYTPPPKSARVWPDTAPSAATLWAVTGVLVAGFIMGRMPPLWRAYSKYMTLVTAYPNSLSVIGAIFRHDTVAHLGWNLLTLWFIGLSLHENVGRGTFLAIFLATGTAGAFASLAVNVLRQQWTAYIFGCSGSVLGVFAALCTLRPNSTISVFGYDVPIAAWVFLALFGSLEAIAIVRRLPTAIDHVGHLGGMVTGFGAGLWMRQKVRREQMVATPSEEARQPTAAPQ